MAKQLSFFGPKLVRGMRVSFDGGWRDGVIVEVRANKVRIRWYHSSEPQPQLCWVDRTAVTPAARNGR